MHPSGCESSSRTPACSLFGAGHKDLLICLLTVRVSIWLRLPTSRSVWSARSLLPLLGSRLGGIRQRQQLRALHTLREIQTLLSSYSSFIPASRASVEVN